jgi:hypothetical protein
VTGVARLGRSLSRARVQRYSDLTNPIALSRSLAHTAGTQHIIVSKRGQADYSSGRVPTVAQKTVPMFCHFEQTCTNLTLTPKPALEKNQGDSTTSYLQVGALHSRFGQKLTEK